MAIKWKQFKLVDLINVSNNKVTSFDGEKEYMSTGDIDRDRIVSHQSVTFLNKPSRADLIFTEKDLLFAKMKATTKVLSGKKEFEDKIFSTGFYIFSPKENVSKSYLYFFLISEGFNLQKDSYCKGATMSALSNEGLRKIKINIPINKDGEPDYEEQEKIASLLEEAEHLKNKRTEANQKMENLVTDLFEKFFGKEDFSKDKIVNLVVDKNSIRTGPFGSQLHHHEFTDVGVPVLGIDNVVKNKFRWTYKRCLSEEKFSKFTRFQVYPGDVLVTIMGTVGRVVVAPGDLPQCMSTKHLCVITTNKSKLNSVYLWASLLFDNNVRKQTQNVSKGAIMEGWNSTIIKNLVISLPPIELQNKFADLVKEIEIQKDKQKQSTQMVDELFNAVMAKSFA